MIYKIIQIDNLLEIQKDLTTYLPFYFKNFEICDSGFYGSDIEIIKKNCFRLKKFLIDINLLDRWNGVGISVLKNKESLNIHSDSLKKNRIFALNIPICNCNNSYTIWYQKKNLDTRPQFKYYVSESVHGICYFEYRDDDVTEIDRLDCSIPAFVNIKIPHRGISLNNKKRFLISLRFEPELTLEEIINL